MKQPNAKNHVIVWSGFALIGVLTVSLGVDMPSAVKVLCGASLLLVSVFVWAKLEEL